MSELLDEYGRPSWHESYTGPVFEYRKDTVHLVPRALFSTCINGITAPFRLLGRYVAHNIDKNFETYLDLSEGREPGVRHESKAVYMLSDQAQSIYVVDVAAGLSAQQHQALDSVLDEFEAIAQRTPRSERPTE
jgi:hypothetical protein